MIRVGETTGNLQGMLADIANFYEKRADNRVRKIMALAEPMLILLMGLLIGAVIITMYLPIFYVVDVIR